MAANKFVLKGPGVEVDYTIGATPAIPALVYTAGAFQKKFKPNEVLSEDTGLGRMVSATPSSALKSRTSAGSTRSEVVPSGISLAVVTRLARSRAMVLLPSPGSP